MNSLFGPFGQPKRKRLKVDLSFSELLRVFFQHVVFFVKFLLIALKSCIKKHL